MPYAVTHILVAVILVELFRDYFVRNNKRFPRYYILIAAIGAIIPDLDIAAYYILYFFGFTFDQIHKTFVHTLFVPLILFLIGLAALKLNVKNKKLGESHIRLSTVFFILAFGSLLHLTLDALFWDGITPFYPFLTTKINFNLLLFFPEALRWMILPTIDGILLLFWLFWMEFKLKIDNYL